jgi:hypothetical protein
MEYKIHGRNGKQIIEVHSPEIFIRSAQDMLDLMVNVPSNIIVVKKEMLDETFFDLKTGLAGEILQKLSNYSVKLGIVGDYSAYTSKSLKDFIYESNKVRHIVFVDTLEIAIEKLTNNL